MTTKAPAFVRCWNCKCWMYRDSQGLTARYIAPENGGYAPRECHRHAPGPMAMIPNTLWPMTLEGDGCFEGLPRK